MTTPLSSFADVFNGKTPSRSEQRGKGHPVLKVKDVDGRGHFVGTFDSYVDFDFVEAFRQKLIRRGDTLILNAAHNADYVGSKIYKAQNGVVGALATGEWLIVRPKRGKLAGSFAYHWLLYGETRQRVRKLVKGIHLYPKDVGQMRVVFPKLQEQKRIATLLNKAEAVLIKRRQTIENLNSLLKSIFLGMFDDPISKGWAMTNIAEIVKPVNGSIRTGPFGSQLLHGEFTDEGVAVLGIDNAVANEFRWGQRRFISESKYRQLARYTVHPGDVLITIMGTCGRCAVVPDKIPRAINTKHLCCITLDRTKCLPTFLHAYFLQHPMARKYLAQRAKGAIMSGLNMGIIKAMPVPLPPVELQREFARQVAAVERLKRAQQESLKKLDTLFTSLQHRAFRGEL
ncbi:MAG: restriction endonuclease subunit S [Acidobacteriota bacterium]|nr:restriction endonuclease subunit S [Acidobacteriota bacterium]